MATQKAAGGSDERRGSQGRALGDAEVTQLAADCAMGAEVAVAGQRVVVRGSGGGRPVLAAPSGTRHFEVKGGGALELSDVTLSGGKGREVRVLGPGAAARARVGGWRS